MLLYRSASVLHLYKLSPSPLPKLRFLSHSNHSYSNFTLFCIKRSFQNPIHHFSTSAAAASTAKNDDTFFANDDVSWSSLGLSNRVSQSVFNSGLQRPSLVQAASIPSILSGKDVVVAAETGSGKTHSYLVPLIDKLCDLKSDPTEELRISLVLCPNVLLCEQVVRMASGLCDDNGQPLINVAALGGRQGWPVKRPDIIVSTPAALLNNIDTTKDRRLNFMRAVKYVVFDEADMLLCGGFQNQVIRLINMLRYDEKLLSRGNNFVPTATDIVELGSDSVGESRAEDEEVIQDKSLLEEEENFEDDVQEEVVKEGDGSTNKKDWRRVRKEYVRSKQYIFVAATLPVNGKKTAGAVLKWMFPDANWISGNYLHCHNPRLQQKWIEVTVDSQVDALIDAVKQGSGSGVDVSRTMVFANTVDAVEAVVKILERAGIECYRYHKDTSLEERAKALVDFRDKGGIFVCTDAAARGVDVPNVSHVIQADFATSAVDFLHRVGRTARAGQYGLVTSLYTESNRDLVGAIRQAKKLGQPVESAFSRKRSFRNKLKKRGSNKASNASTNEMVRI